MIGSSENRISYNGNGVATEFAYQFKILEKTDLYVLHVAADGTEKILTKDYYVDMEKSVVHYPGYAPGAEIPEADRPPVLPVGERLVLYREVPITQESALDKHWPFNVIENMADKLTIICQQIWDRLGRSLFVSVSTSETFNPQIPAEAGKSFRVNDEGTGFVAMENPETVLAENKDILAQVIILKNETADYKDTTQNYMDTTEGYMEAAAGSTNLAERWAQAVDSPDGIAGNESSKTWATWAANSAHEAEVQADRAEAAGAKAEMYDSTKTYSSTDVVMLPNGDVYRCLTESTGENPAISTKWAAVAQVVSKTFEADEYGDLMPLATPKTSSNWNIDDNGDVMPSELEGIEYRLEFDANGDLQPINYL